MSVTPGDVQRFLRDYPDFNILLKNFQFDPEDVNAAMRFAISEFNALTPISSYTQTNFPNEWILLLGTAAHLCLSEAFLQLRNQVTYQDGDVAVGIDDKHQPYMALQAALKADWKEAAKNYKQQKNMEACYDSLSSGYRYLRGLRRW